MTPRKALPKPLQRSEHDEQSELFAWMATAPIGMRPCLELAFAIPNFAGHHGSKVSRLISGKKAKAEGRKSGVPDVFLPVAKGGFHGLFIEMKRADGTPSDVSHDQTDWINALRGEGFRVEVCYGFEQARLTLVAYLTYLDTPTLIR